MAGRRDDTPSSSTGDGELQTQLRGTLFDSPLPSSLSNAVVRLHAQIMHTHTHTHTDSLSLLLNCLRYQQGCPSSQRQALTTMAAMCTRLGQYHQIQCISLPFCTTILHSVGNLLCGSMGSLNGSAVYGSYLIIEENDSLVPRLKHRGEPGIYSHERW